MDYAQQLKSGGNFLLASIKLRSIAIIRIHIWKRPSAAAFEVPLTGLIALSGTQVNTTTNHTKINTLEWWKFLAYPISIRLKSVSTLVQVFVVIIAAFDGLPFSAHTHISSN